MAMTTVDFTPPIDTRSRCSYNTPLSSAHFEIPAYSFHRSPDSLRFLRGLYCRDPDSRARALNCACKTMDEWLGGYGSPPNHCATGGADCFTAADMSLLVREQLPDILRLSVECPFSDLRERCSKYLLDLQERGVDVPKRTVFSASSFIPQSNTISLEDDSNESTTRLLLINAFLQTSRVDHLLQVLAYHPLYLESFLKNQQFLMRGNGPLPYHFRHYIAILGGDENWLRGLDHIPAKLRNLSEINKFLAHRPWLITKEHIHTLTTGPDKWSLSELMQALVLLAHFHSLSSFVYGSGLNPEIDHEGGHTFRTSPTTTRAPLSPLNSPLGGSTGNGAGDQGGSNSARVFLFEGRGGGGIGELGVSATNGHHSVTANDLCSTKVFAANAGSSTALDSSIDQVMLRMRDLERIGLGGGGSGGGPGGVGGSECFSSEDAMRESFERVETQNTEQPVPGGSLPVTDAASTGIASRVLRDTEDIAKRYVEDAEFSYQYLGNTRRGSGGAGSAVGGKGGMGVCMAGRVTSLRTGEFSWEHEGYSLSCRLYMEVGELLEEKFNITKTLTYHTMGDNVNVDTKSFRDAIWNYTHCLYGIRHEEYDYSVVNELLDDQIKSFIKTVACYPRRVTAQLYDSFMRELKHSEKIHVNLLLLEARMQAELVYGLRAVSQYLCST